MLPKPPKSKRYDILGVSVDAITKQAVLADVTGQIQHHSSSVYITKPYVEFLTLARRDPVIAKILTDSYLCLADGVSLQWAASFLYGQPHSKPTLRKVVWSGLVWLQKSSWRNQVIPEKMAGVNLTVPMLHLAEKQGWRIGVLGGPADHTMTATQLYKKFPDLPSVETWNGYYDIGDESKLAKEIAASHLDILFVALGFPKQELFMAKYASQTKAKVLVGEGGSFDYDALGGKIKRAPQWLQRVGLEWLWRLVRQPSRLKRQMAIPRFVWAVYTQARTNYRALRA